MERVGVPDYGTDVDGTDPEETRRPQRRRTEECPTNVFDVQTSPVCRDGRPSCPWTTGKGVHGYGDRGPDRQDSRGTDRDDYLYGNSSSSQPPFSVTWMGPTLLRRVSLRTLRRRPGSRFVILDCFVPPRWTHVSARRLGPSSTLSGWVTDFPLLPNRDPQSGRRPGSVGE